MERNFYVYFLCSARKTSVRVGSNWQGFLNLKVKSLFMKYTKKNMLAFIAFLIGLACSLSGCAESYYYRTYHHHSREWYEYHHSPPPQDVNFDLDIHH